MSHRHTLFRAVAFLVLAACGGPVGPSAADGTLSAAAAASLEAPSDPGSCIAGLKAEVYAGTLSFAGYEARALSDCGIDFSAPLPPPPEEPPAPLPPEPTAAELAFIACANALKGQVTAGTLPIEQLAAAVEAQCPKPPPPAK